jgi:hypothetical protein
MNPLELQVLAILSGNEEDAQRTFLAESPEPSPVLAAGREMTASQRESKPRRPRRAPRRARAALAR